MLKRTLPNRTQRLLGVSAIAIASAGVCAVAWAAQPAHVVVEKAPHIARADAAPFIEPPVSDPAQLLGAPAAADEIQLADAQPGEPTGHAKSDDSPDDEDAGQAADATDDVDAEADAAEGDAVVVDGDHVSARHLTSEERARIRAAVAQARAAANQARAAARVAQSQAVREAMAQSRAALAEARTAAREAQVEGMRAARAAQVESVRAAVAAARDVNSPEMRAEIRAMAAEAAQMARDVHMSDQDREAMRASIRAHAERLRELSRRSCTRDHADRNDANAHSEHD